MAISVGINGFGRIGRLTARMLLDRGEQFELRLVNDLAEPGILGQLLERDSTYGPLGEDVRIGNGGLVVGDRTIAVTREQDPARIPWKDAGVDVVLESTGALRRRDDVEKHLAAGARRVLLSAPAKGDRPMDAEIVVGVNDDVLEPDHVLVSAASCTTNCLAPMLLVLDERFGIEAALVTTVHAYTSSQHLLDGIDKDPYRARSATQNIIPTTTGAARAAVHVLPHLEGKLAAMAMRVPVPTGSVVDLGARLETAATPEDVNEALREAADGKLRGVLQYTERPTVSSDIVGNPHSCVVDGHFTATVGDRTVKVMGWYDNEWGYAARCVDMLQRLGTLGTAGA